MVQLQLDATFARTMENAAVHAVTEARLVTPGTRPAGTALLALVEDLLRQRVEAVLGDGYGVYLTDRSVSVNLPAVVGWQPRLVDFAVRNSGATLADLIAAGTGLTLLPSHHPALEGVDWQAPSFPGIAVELDVPTGRPSTIGVLVLTEQGAAVQSHRAGSSGPEGERRSAYETNDLMVLP